MKNNTIDKVLTFSEASKIWGKSDSTFRMLIRTGKLKEGVDYRKSGNVWLVTRKAMIRIYGEASE